MIRYRLRCSNGHDFDAWFRTSGDCDAQIERGLIGCAHCGDSTVEKALMTPGVRPSGQKTDKGVPASKPPEAAAPSAPVSVAAMPPEHRKAVEALREIRNHLVKNADYVGPQFAEEARKIHFGEADKRGIYGEATPEDVRELAEDGVDILPIPMLPEDRN